MEPTVDRMLVSETPIYIYTDASVEGTNIGCSWAACDGEFIISKDTIPLKECGVFQAEVIAIKEALTWIKKSHPSNRNYVMKSDSQSAIKKTNGDIVIDSNILSWRQ